MFLDTFGEIQILNQYWLRETNKVTWKKRSAGPETFGQTGAAKWFKNHIFRNTCALALEKHWKTNPFKSGIHATSPSSWIQLATNCKFHVNRRQSRKNSVLWMPLWSFNGCVPVVAFAATNVVWCQPTNRLSMLTSPITKKSNKIAASYWLLYNADKKHDDYRGAIEPSEIRTKFARHSETIGGAKDFVIACADGELLSGDIQT